jgi:hypothetical protein
MSISKLAKEHTQYEAKRKLVAMHDFFLADKRLSFFFWVLFARASMIQELTFLSTASRQANAHYLLDVVVLELSAS